MKTVFTSREIAHVFAHGPQKQGRSPGNASFNGDRFLSYATTIGRRIIHKGRMAYVLDRASFSSSTSKVQSRLSYALNHSTVFRVDIGSYGQYLDFTPATLRDHYLTVAKERAAILPSRYSRIRAEQYSHVTSAIQDAQRVCVHFGLPHKAIDNTLAKRAAGQADADSTMKAARAKAIENKAKAEAHKVVERTAATVKQAQDYLAGIIPHTRFMDLTEKERALNLLPTDLRAAFVAKVEAGNAGLVNAWLAGGKVELPYNANGGAVMLRTIDGNMETSKGATVPIADAERAFRFATKARAKGWHKNGEQCKVGNYQLDAVNAEGVIAGCHRVKWNEIERFAASQGWAA